MTTYSGTCGELSVTLGGLEGTLLDDDSFGASIDRWWFGWVGGLVWVGLACFGVDVGVSEVGASC